MKLLERLTHRSPRNAQTIKDAQSYLSKRYALLKVELLEKSSQILSVIFSMLIVVVCALAVLIYLSNAIIGWLTLALNAAWAYTIVCALFILITIIVLHNRERLFVNPLIRKFSTILFTQEEKDEENPSVEEKGGAHE